ncbi:hypothetical protein HDU67_007471 [Dinochytrium kinnereticum]|nr:hypothetical protein HDU67_007471 [Dinochytrium kinnereticum]
MPSDGGRKVLLLRLDGQQQAQASHASGNRDATLNAIRSHGVNRTWKDIVGQQHQPAKVASKGGIGRDPLGYARHHNEPSGFFAHTSTGGTRETLRFGPREGNHPKRNQPDPCDLPSPGRSMESLSQLPRPGVRAVNRKGTRNSHERSFTDPPPDEEERRRSYNLGGIIAKELKQSASAVSDQGRGLGGGRGLQKEPSFLPEIDEARVSGIGGHHRKMQLPSLDSDRGRSLSNPVGQAGMKNPIDILPHFNAARGSELPGRKVSLVTSYGSSIVRFLPSLPIPSRNPSFDRSSERKNSLALGEGALQVCGIFKTEQNGSNPTLHKPEPADIRHSLSSPEGLGQEVNSGVDPLKINALMEYRQGLNNDALKAIVNNPMSQSYQEKMSKYLSPQEIRDRMLDYDASMQKNGQRRRLSSIDAGERPAWRPGGAMAAINFAEVMKNRMRAKEVAERTRKAVLGDDDEEEIDLDRYNDKDYIYFSADSVAEDTVGPFHHEPEDLRDSNGNILPTANKFAHHVLKVMNRYEEQPVSQISMKPLQPRPAAAPKPKINYPMIRRKRADEEEPNQPEEVVLEPEPVHEEQPEPRPKTYRPPTQKKKHIREILELIVEKMEDEPLPTRDHELSLRELRVIFVNDFAIIDNRATAIRENEMAMLLRDIDVLPNAHVEAISPELICEMCWNLFRYLRAVLPDCLVPKEVGLNIIDVMEQEEEEEHRKFEMQRIIAKLPREDFVIIKAVLGHLARLGEAFYAEGVHLHKAIAFLFSNLLFQVPSHRINVDTSSTQRSTPQRTPADSSQDPTNLLCENMEEAQAQPPASLDEISYEASLQAEAGTIKADDSEPSPPPPPPTADPACEDPSGPAPETMNLIREEPEEEEVVEEKEKDVEERGGVEGPKGDEVVDQEGAGADIDFGQDDAEGFGWNLHTRRSMARTLLLEELVHTASSSALHLLLTHYESVFSYHSDTLR